MIAMLTAVASMTLIECFTSGVLLSGTVYTIAKTQKSPSDTSKKLSK